MFVVARLLNIALLIVETFRLGQTPMFWLSLFKQRSWFQPGSSGAFVAMLQGLQFKGPLKGLVLKMVKSFLNLIKNVCKNSPNSF